MRICFKSVKGKNFLSYKDLYLELSDQGYVSVKGENNFKADNAESNGSGKSSWISAIFWCLTGTTVQGVKSNLSNIYVNENECWVELELSIDSDDYILRRTHKPKSNLQIIKNGEDVSGKGLKESEAQLQLLIPDLNRELLASTIILGQGLPDKISNLSPSGRKDLLEKLSKSDFMIEDIKNRIDVRGNLLNTNLREVEDEKIRKESLTAFNNNQIINLENRIKELLNVNYDEEIENSKNQLEAVKVELSKISENISCLEKNMTNLSDQKMDLLTRQNDEIQKVRNLYVEPINQVQSELANKKAQAWTLANKIKQLDSIVDTCPTCGQKLPNRVKPDTTNEKNNLQILNKEVSELDTKLNELKNKANLEEETINNNYKDQICSLTKQITGLNGDIYNQKSSQDNLVRIKNNTENTYNRAVLNKQNLQDNIQKAKDDIEKYRAEITFTETELAKLQVKKTNLTDKLEINKKMNTLSKRDFRGYLLTNIINYIDVKAKEYCKFVFDHENIKFELDGNNIDILFNDKYMESLSGGEQQKINLILQFAIRDMLECYTDFNCNCLMLDEITDSLDSSGVDKMFNLIAEKLSGIESLFIISHHADELRIPCDKDILIVKDKNGISSIFDN